jgi:hypothetical protein
MINFRLKDVTISFFALDHVFRLLTVSPVSRTLPVSCSSVVNGEIPFFLYYLVKREICAVLDFILSNKKSARLN